MNSSDSDSDPKDSVTAVAEQSFVRERVPDIERGTLLAGRYQIEEIIGKGGSGVVLRAFDRTAQAVVALKVLKSELARDAKWDKRFSRELRLARPIQHPNVCRIFDIGEADGHRFLTMELARGGSLRDELKRGLSLPPRSLSERLADASAAIAGLAAIHAAGVVHRDFKPDNLLRMEDGRLVLSDFGLATDTANAPGVTVLIGTPHYMAPEVLAGEPATTRSDVWALGVVLHEILFARRPERRAVSFDGSTKMPLRLESAVERAMLALCERCLSESPLDRPADAGLVAELYERQRLIPGHVGPASQRQYFVGFALGLVALMIAGGLAWRAHRRPRDLPKLLSQSGLARLSPIGEPADWHKLATLVAELPGHVHCFSMLEGKTARVIWGAPRRAEDIDVATGSRRPARLTPVAYAVGCPEQSPDGKRLLFAALNSSGTTEIRLSSQVDGSNATTVVSGFEPLWLANGDEFLYSVDPFHAAVFVLPTSSSRLLPEADSLEHRPILEKAVSTLTDEVALLFGSNRSERLIAIYEGSELTLPKTFAIPGGYEIRFDGTTDQVLVSYQLSAMVSSLTELDWKHGVLRNVGTYAGLDLISAVRRNDEIVLLGRHRTKDVWLYGSGSRRRMTSDGQNFSAAISPFGDLLLSKRSDGGKVSIWWQGRDGATREVSTGPADVEPQFSRDGRWWLYVDYVRKSIMLCSVETGRCRALLHDESLPCWPQFSPDGKTIAYLTQLNVPKLMIVSIDDGKVRQMGDAYNQCPPVWSSPNSLWSFEGAAGRHFWSERNATTGEKTGQRTEVKGSELGASLASADEVQCWPPDASANSLFFRPLRVETDENSRLLRFVPRAMPE